MKSHEYPRGQYALEPSSNAKEEDLKGSHSDDPVYDKAPPRTTAETTLKINDLLKTRGFHKAIVSVFDADALIRGDKTDIISSASHNVQKGDWLVLATESLPGLNLFHDINKIVWEVSFVSNIPHSRSDNGFEQVALSIRRIPDTRFKKGVGGLDECIVFEENRKA